MAQLPIVLSSLRDVHEWRRSLPAGKSRVGFVPTMGALHEGHATLLRKIRPRCEISVLSIFVNPTQFGPNEDLSKYPRTWEADLAIAAREGVDVVFAPAPEMIYPAGYSTYVEETLLSQRLCGSSRPGHFRGVTTVVLKLFNLIQPELALFGLKDAQQYFVLHKMVQDLHLNVRVEGVPTVRETDGLAMSSRNVYLSATEREIAPRFYRELQACAGSLLGDQPAPDGRGHLLLNPVSAAEALTAATESLSTAGFQVQYLECLELPDLRAIGSSGLDKDRSYLLAGACYLGKTRLIDNIILRPDSLESRISG